MAKTSIGIDIGLNSIKIVELVKDSGGNIVLKKVGVHYSTTDIDAGENLKLFDDSNFLKEIRKKYKIARSRPAVISLPSNSVFVRYVDILKTKRTKEIDLIEYEAKQQIPLPLDEVAWDYSVFNKDDSGAKKAILVAVKKELVDDSASVVRESGFLEKAVSLSLFSLLELSKRLRIAKRSEGLIVIDIGLDSTGIIIGRGSHVWLRSFSFASKKFTESIADNIDVAFDHAETIKREGPVALKQTDNNALLDRIKSSISSDLDSLLGEVERSINYYKAEYILTDPLLSDETFQNFHIVLTGGGSKLQGLVERFEDKFEMSVSMLNSFAGISVDRGAFKNAEIGGINSDEDIESEVNPLLSVAVGAALQGFRKEDTINFLKKDIAVQKSFSIAKYFRFFSYVFFIGSLFVNVYYQQQELSVYKQHLKGLQKNEELMDTYAPQLDLLEKNNSKMLMKNLFLQNYVDKRYLWLSVLSMISEVLPANAWLTNFHGIGAYFENEDNELMLNGVTLSYDELNEFIAKLRKIDLVEEVKAESVVEDNDKFNFLLKLKIKKLILG